MRQRLDEESDALPEVGEPIRPEPSPPAAERVREWIDWFGLTRLVTSAAAVVVVCAGAWLLVRTPPPPSEASLPVAAAANGSPTEPAATLPVATAVDAAPSTLTAGPLVVHVAGAVVVPGVYELGSGSRVDDAVRRAGGPTDAAELGRINLAAPLVDGDMIYVPETGEDLPPPRPQSPAADATPTAATPVDVNRASATELETLPGVGPATAAAIVAERDLNGPFASFEDLERVPGIGPAKLAGLVGLVVT